MADGRIIKKCISESKTLAILNSDSSRLLYTWLIPHADSSGRYLSDPEIIKGHIVPKIKTMTIYKIKKLLDELAESNLIILYQEKDEHYLQITKFEEHQKLLEREAKSKIPSPINCQIFRFNQIKSELLGALQPNSLELNRIKENRIKEKEKVEPKDSTFPLSQIIIEYFNQKTGQKRSLKSQETQKLINGRISEGRILEDFIKVIDKKFNQWKDDPKMMIYLRPSTLFRPGNFEDYLNEPEIKTEKEKFEEHKKKVAEWAKKKMEEEGET
jgi:uncharacterized phage protein (TIGR02220 family)